MTALDPYLARITRYPIKSLDGEVVATAELESGSGAFVGDRSLAIVDEDEEYVNGKRTPDVHSICVEYLEDATELTIPGAGVLRSSDIAQSAEIETALSDYFGYPVRFDRQDLGGHPDDTTISGPTVISTGSLEEVASWFDNIDTDGMRRRFRANIEIGGVPAFWEDRLYADYGQVVRFRIGDVHFNGVSPCARCVVPARDPDTGEETHNFQLTFVRGRKQSKPPWLDSERFDHPYRLMVNTDLAKDSPGHVIAEDDPVEIIGDRPA